MLAAMAVTAFAQQRNNEPVPSFAGAVEDFKPNSTNQPGKQYPMVNSQGAVRVQLRAPSATSAQIDLVPQPLSVRSADFQIVLI